MDPVQTHVAERGDTPALLLDDRVVTWRELDARGNQAARALAGQGVSAGDRVAIALRNSIEFYEIVVGAGRLGATVMPVSFRLLRDEVEYLVDDAHARIVIAEPDNRDVFAGLPDTIFGGDEYEDWLGAESATRLTDQVGTALAPLRFYTAGTTGRPKAVIRTPHPSEHPERHAAALRAAQAVFDVRLSPVSQPGEVHLVAGVVYHTAPGGYSTMALTWGHTLVIMDHFDAEEALRLVERHRVTWTQMAPIHLVRIVGLPDEVKQQYDLSSLKRLLHAGAPCPVDVKWKTLELFPGDVVHEYYAATEGYATECPAADWTRKPGTVGRPAPGITIRILDDDGNEVPAGEVGLVYIDNGSRFEYEGAPEQTADTWRGDEFSVGDMGYIDDEGYLFLTDRASHMIISGGANIYPAEVENVLFGHPDVADVSVIGVPDDEYGEQVKAVVETRREVSDTELLAFCRERLAGYKCPKSVDFVDELPRDPNGKIRKSTLRDPYWEGRATRI
ncbi:MAG: AMP-binding protein [Acidimicrobiia bacterium]